MTEKREKEREGIERQRRWKAKVIKKKRKFMFTIRE